MENKSVAGNIHKPQFRRFWISALKESRFLQDFLAHGYKIPLFRYPPKVHLPNNDSAKSAEDICIIEKSLKEGTREGLFVEVSKPPHLILPIQVVDRDEKKKRLVIDASRSLNNYIRKRRVTLDHLHKIADSFPRNWWVASMDVSSGYYHIKVAPEHETLLGMRWTWSNGVTKYYKWKVAFLGISDLVYFFTKNMMPVKRYLQSQGVSAFIYISLHDDSLILGNSKADCEAKLQFARETWRNAGWVENRKKAMDPTQVGTFLGLNINLKEYKIFFPLEKIIRVKAMITLLLKQPCSHVREIAKVYGLIGSGLLAFGPIIHFLCREGYKLLAHAPSWDCTLKIESIKDELLYIKENLNALN